MVNTVAPSRIQHLSTSLANQIAAGEVIERPASVVKELLENSLDAGATEIKLEIKKGGRSLIRLVDNGHGIHPDDLQIALAQHATSKLFSEDDLANIATLGFRGEALSSIASVSRLKLASRIHEQEHGWLLESTDGNKKPMPMNVGTQIEVQDLFFNTPARRKFLRTDNTEFFHIKEIVRRMALSRNNVSFHLIHNNKNILQCSRSSMTNAAGMSERVAEILGKKFMDQSLAINCEHDGLRLTGWIGQPEFARNQMDQQYFYLNGRVIKDKQVNHAIRMATQNYLYAGKHAVYVLFLEMDVGEVDVNVHPAKHEVRFRRARDVHDFIYSALSQKLENQNAPSSVNDLLPDQQQYVSEASKQNYPSIREGKTTYSSSAKKQNVVEDFFQKQASVSTDNQSFIYIEPYALIRDEHSVHLLDVPKCNELVVLSKLRNEFQQKDVRRRPLLVPVNLGVDASEANLLEKEVATLEKYGLVLERVSATSILIREFPMLLEFADLGQLIKSILKQLRGKGSNESILETMATHVNDSGQMILNDKMIKQLVNDLKLLKADALSDSETILFNHAWKLLDKEALAEILMRNSSS